MAAVTQIPVGRSPTACPMTIWVSSMKFFTRELFNAQQGNPDLPEVIAAGKEWDTAREGYHKHLDSILPRLPSSMRDFCDTTLHDGVVRAVERNGDSFRIEIDACGCWGASGPVELVFRGVVSAAGIEEAIGDYWLYEEVHLSDNAGFEYHVLLEDTEMLIVASEIEFREKLHGP